MEKEYLQCKGKAQSPIDITLNDIVHDSSLLPIVAHNHDNVYSWNVSQNGHTSKAIIANLII